MGIGIALAGGGIRGIAHAGVLKALEDNNIKIEAIAGTSAGSIVAALYAMGYKPYYIYVLFKKYAQDIINIGNAPIVNGIGNFIKNKKIGFAGLNDGTTLEKMYNELALRKGVKVIGDIEMPLAIPAVDILDSKEYIFTNCAPRNNPYDNYITEIDIGKAVRASCSFPAMFCPCEFKNHMFMDGGTLDNIPVLPLKKICDQKIIAVNFAADPVGEDSDVMDIIMKTIDIMGNQISKESLEQSDFVLTVSTDRAGLFDIEKLDKCYKFGYDAVMQHIKRGRFLFCVKKEPSLFFTHIIYMRELGENMNIIYFDNSATTKIKTEVLNEMMPYLTTEFGNASSVYSIGRKSKKAIENSRRQVAELIGSNANEIYFTSGGSESDNIALKGFAYGNREKGNHIITSKIEHPAILETCRSLQLQGFEVSYINVDEDGIINLDELKNAIRETTILISVMTANNEIGTIQPIEEIARIAHSNNIAFHTDAVQAIGNMPIKVNKIGIDMLSLSGHKINAPKGVGVLYIRNGIQVEKIVNGGHQEKDKRAGTENIAGIVGLGKACEIANKNMETHIKNLTKLRDYYIKKLQTEMPDKIRINGSIEKRLPGNANISFEGVDSAELIYKLDENGICVSAGSACSSGNKLPSHVLSAINVPERYLNSAIRTTFGDTNTFEEIDYFVKNLKMIIAK